jgi:hypothetical protein
MSDLRPVPVERIEQTSRLSDPYAQLLDVIASADFADRLLAIRLGGLDIETGLHMQNAMWLAVNAVGERQD